MPSEYKPNAGVVSLTDASVTVRADAHAGVPLIFNRAAGTTATLPAATGSGFNYEFIVGTALTSNSNIIRVANSVDIMVGNAILLQDAGDTMVGFETAGTSDTITFNGTTTGGVRGARALVTDIAAGVYWVQVVSAATGTEATPFSATV
jgi:hypothetical protein